jgi:hypothetical protein
MLTMAIAPHAGLSLMGILAIVVLAEEGLASGTRLTIVAGLVMAALASTVAMTA